MRSYVISDNRDTWVGMGLAGIEGIIVHEREVFLETMQQLLKDKSIGIIILTEQIVQLAPSEVLEWKLKTAMPLIVELPNRHGTIHEKSLIQRYMKVGSSK